MARKSIGWVAKASTDFDAYDWDERVATGVPVRVERYPDWQLSVDVDLTGRLLGLRVLAPGGLGTRALRQLPLEEVRRAARNAVAYWLDQIKEPGEGMVASAGMKARLDALSADFGDRKPPGNRGKGDLFYAEVARDYERLCAGPGAVQALAKERGCVYETARDWVRIARRQKGMLTEPPGPGRQGGETTPKAKALLAGSQTGSQTSRASIRRR